MNRPQELSTTFVETAHFPATGIKSK